MNSNSRRWSTIFSISICVIASFVLEVNGHWWSLATNPLMDTLILGTTPMCTQLEGLSRNQRALCQKYDSHMQYVSEGASAGISECKFQFRGDRWNCSTVEDSSVFGKVLKIGSKETAFTYAISAAGVVVAVAKACKNGELPQCECSTAGRPVGLDSEWRWGGCGDNIEYAYGFAREFIDARERDNVSPRNTKEKARKSMNMHNNEAGRMVAVRSARPFCKCHGVSGSCSIKTCWMQIPDFRELGDELKIKYKHAIEVKSSSRGVLRPRRSGKAIDRTSLVYLDSSPDYCTQSKRNGVLGTKGRECQRNTDGQEGCGKMCCGRGSKTLRVRVVERCNCKFQWCCSVKCSLCESVVKKHVCK